MSACNGPAVKAMTVVGEVEEKKCKEKTIKGHSSVSSCDTQQRAARSAESIFVTMQTAV